MRPLLCRRAGPASAALARRPGAGAPRRERLERVLREACKQSRRAWLPELQPPAGPAELAAELAGERPARAVALLEPGAPLSLDTWVRALLAEGGSPASREQPLVLVVGPEGGLTEEERGALLEAGAGPVRLGPHVLRIETAAEAAVAIAMGLFA